MFLQEMVVKHMSDDFAGKEACKRIIEKSLIDLYQTKTLKDKQLDLVLCNLDVEFNRHIRSQKSINIKGEASKKLSSGFRNNRSNHSEYDSDASKTID